MKTSIVALLTDFGLTDHYVGVVKGVILSRAPHVQIVDISHGVRPQNIDQAGYLLWAAYKYFPEGTIFVSVVDPGVGSRRKIICATGDGYIFLAPDNGLLKYVFGEIKHPEVYAVTAKRYFLKNVSKTFHGRDVFASVAGFLANGLVPSKLGKRIKGRISSERFAILDSARKVVVGKVIHVDRFGNLITNFLADVAQTQHGKRVTHLGNISLRLDSTQKLIRRVYPTYNDAPNNEPFIVLGSSGLLEISIKTGNAAAVLGVGQGDRITLFRKKG